MQPAYAKADTGRWIEDTGFVRRLLQDDDDGSRHQRFIIQLSNRQTLLIAHNIDVAERIPLSLGDRPRSAGRGGWRLGKVSAQSLRVGSYKKSRPPGRLFVTNCRQRSERHR
jgi:hypothetical protein